jgi:hypothetical protein
MVKRHHLLETFWAVLLRLLSSARPAKGLHATRGKNEESIEGRFKKSSKRNGEGAKDQARVHERERQRDRDREVEKKNQDCVEKKRGETGHI